MNRREFIVGPATVMMTWPFSAMAAEGPAQHILTANRFQRFIAEMASIGPFRSGGAGEREMARRLESRLAARGFDTMRQDFEIPHFEPALVELNIAESEYSLVALAPFRLTPPGGITGQLAACRLRQVPEDLQDSIALVELPYARHSNIGPNLVETLNAVAAAGARGAIIITTGPTGEAVPLNARPDLDLPLPVAIIGDRAATPLMQLLGDEARLTIDGHKSRRMTFNTIARLERRGRPWLIVSTPRSGWGPCIGERGPGLAIFCDLAMRLPHVLTDFSLLFLSTSGHEFENIGSELFIEHAAPAIAETALWAHLGAGIAARDWHDTGTDLLPLPSPDAQRYLLGDDRMLPQLRRSFAGLAGLESPYPIDLGAAGELLTIHNAGYPAFGAFGAHRFHHLPNDGLEMTSGDLIAPVADAFFDAIREYCDRYRPQ